MQHEATLAGRGSEVALLADQLAQAQHGRCQVVMLAGEPGIGKTRLLAACTADAATNGIVVRRGAASDAEGMPPYLPLLEALGQHIRTAPTALLHTQLGDLTPVLATILPELAARMPPVPPMYALPPEQARMRLYEAVGVFLAAIAAPHGLVLVLDDLQWADRATLDLLSFIAQHHADARLLVVGAYRAGEASANPALQRMLTELNRLRILTTLPVGPLAPAALVMLAEQHLGGPLDAATSELLAAQSEGNPFFAEELLRDWRETGVLAWSGSAWRRSATGALALPSSIADALRQRLDRLPPALRELLGVAALMGRVIDVGVLAAATDGDEEAVEEQLGAAARMHLLAATHDAQFAWSHDTIRACLSGDMTQARRRRLHGRIGEALEAHGATLDAGRLAELAFHFVRSGDQTRGVAYAQQAGDAALHVAAASEAAGQYQSALDLLVPGDTRRGPLLYALGTALLQAAAHTDAVLTFESAQAWFLEHGDVLAAARAAEGQGTSWWQQEAISEARAAFELALTLLGMRPLPETVIVLVNLSSLLTLSLLQRDAGLEYARQALTIAHQLEDPRLVATASRALGNGQVRAARLAAGIALLEEARALAVANDDPVEAAACCAGLRMACCWNAEYGRAIAYAHQEIALARRCHTPYTLRHVYTQLVVLSTVTDGVAAGQQVLTTARALCASLAAPEARAYLELTEGMFWGWFQGDYARGAQLARAAVDTWRRLNPHALVWYLGVFAMLLAKIGQHAEAMRNLDELDTLTAGLPQGSIPTGQALSWVATVSLILDDRARLARLAQQLAPFRGCMMTGGMIDRLLGEIAIIQGDLPAARSALANAATFARREGHRWELAQVLVAEANLALAAGGRGSDEQARQLLHAAQGQYRHFGNQAEVDALDRRMTQLAQRSALPGGLSRREAEVLRAVAAGKSNRVIAQELSLSPRTVENHLATIYAKIGAENRASAVAFAIHHGLA